MDKIDFSKYTLNELLEGFSAIDDNAYPDRARELLNRIAAKCGKSVENISAQDIDLVSDLDVGLVGIVGIIGTLSLAVGLEHDEQEILKKIKRIQKLDQDKGTGSKDTLA
jgi:radical SAM superfamily enzyme YgiQ (UPF0313 family)